MFAHIILTSCIVKSIDFVILNETQNISYSYQDDVLYMTGTKLESTMTTMASTKTHPTTMVLAESKPKDIWQSLGQCLQTFSFFVWGLMQGNSNGVKFDTWIFLVGPSHNSHPSLYNLIFIVYQAAGAYWQHWAGRSEDVNFWCGCPRVWLIAQIRENIHRLPTADQ